MKEKKKHDELLAETPQTRQSSSMKRGQQTPTGENGQSELRDLIARRAYEIYEQRGRCDGEDMNDWLRAEAEVRSSLGAPDQGMSGVVKRRPTASRPSA